MAKSRKATTKATEDQAIVEAEQKSLAPVGAGATGPTQPREGSKGALLVAMLSRPDGADITELMAATDWLPHTTRAH